MDRNAILESSKQARTRDENTEFVDSHVRREGELVLMYLMVLLMVYNLLRGIQNDDLMVVFWAYISIIYLHKCKICRQKTDLVTTVAAMVAASVNLLLYFLHTW